MAAGRLGISRVGILTIIEEEFEAAQTVFGIRDHIRGTRYYSSDAGTHDVVLARATDRTNVAATLAARDFIECFRPEVLVILGVAGGIAGRDAGLGDVVAADYLHYAEFRKLTGRGDHARYIAYDQPSSWLRGSCVEPVRVDGGWAQRVEAERPDGTDSSKAWIGSIAVSEKVMGDPSHDEQRRLVDRFTDALAIDMESYGVARAIHEAREAVDYDPLFAVIRGISDLVHVRDDAVEQLPDNNEQRQAWKSYAAHAAATFAQDVVRAVVARPDIREAERARGGRP